MGLVVGTPTTRIDALEKALGNGKFAADIQLPGLLHGKLRLSDQAHARVLSVDTSEAERLPGVKAVLSAWNTPEYRFGSEFQDRTLFAREKVLHRGSFWQRWPPWTRRPLKKPCVAFVWSMIPSRRDARPGGDQARRADLA